MAPPLLLAPPLTHPFGHAQCSPCVGLRLMAKCLTVLRLLGIPRGKFPGECPKLSVDCQKWIYAVPDNLALAFSKPPFPPSSRLSQILLCTPRSAPWTRGWLQGPHLGQASHRDAPATLVRSRKRHSEKGLTLLHPVRKQPQGREPLRHFGSHIHYFSAPDPGWSQTLGSWCAPPGGN